MPVAHPCAWTTSRIRPCHGVGAGSDYICMAIAKECVHRHEGIRLPKGYQTARRMVGSCSSRRQLWRQSQACQQQLFRQLSFAHSLMPTPPTMASRLLIMWLCMSLPSSRDAAMLSDPGGAAAGCAAGLAAWRAAAEFVLLAAAPRGPAAGDIMQSAMRGQ